MLVVIIKVEFEMVILVIFYFFPSILVKKDYR